MLCRAALIPIACGVLLFAGCRSDSGQEAQSRRSVDKETARLLIQSQRALKQGDLRAARILADSVVARAPRLPDAHFQQGRVLSELKRFEDAEAAYRETLALNPDYRGVWYNLGNNAYRQQAYEDAVTFFRRAHALHPSAETLVSLGWTYVAQDEIVRARDAYQDAMARDSSYALAYARLGQLYEDQGNLQQALTYSRKALELEPSNGRYRYAVGSQLLRLDRPDPAVRHLRRATVERPWHQGAHFSLGQALMRLGREQEAERYLAQADSLEQAQSEIKRLQGVARSNAENPAVWKRLGDKLREIGRDEEARQALSVALYRSPGDPDLRNELAMLTAELGNPQAALGHYRALLSQYPSNVEAWFNLGVVYARVGNERQAQRAWQEVLRRDPNHQRAREYLSQISSGGS
jgi:tetratricopeptide (TPR) repeat protein